MEEEKRSVGETKRGVKLGGLGGGGRMVVFGGALVAATVWSICKFRRRKPSCKKGTLKDFQTPNSEKVKNVDEGGDGLRYILRNPKLPVGGKTEERDVSDTSALKLHLDVEKILELGKWQEEKIVEVKKIEDDGRTNENMVLILKEDGLTCEAVYKMKQEAVEVCHESLDADAFSSVSEDELAVSGDELGSGSQLDEDSRLMEDAEVKIDRDFGASEEVIMVKEMREVVQFESLADDGIRCQKKGDEVVQVMNPVVVRADGNKCENKRGESVNPATPDVAVDDDCNDIVSENLDFEGEDGSEGSSGGMTDSSSAETNVEIGLVESLEKLSQDISNEKTLNEIVAVDDDGELISAANGNWSTANGIHQNEHFDDHVSMYNHDPGSTAKVQIMGNSTRLRVWVSSVLLVLLAVLLAQHTYLPPALTGSLSSITAFLMK